MKLWYSFTKELKLASLSWYFYIEIGMALVMLVILLFVVPENFDNRTDEYLYLDLPAPVASQFEAAFLEEDEDGMAEQVQLEINDKTITATQYTSDSKHIYVLDNKEDTKAFAEKENKFAAYIYLNDKEALTYEYFLQGYEADRLKNLFMVIHNKKASVKEMEAYMNNHQEQVIDPSYTALSDRENVIPVFLAFNSGLMGMFIISAYIFLDKHEHIITAYAVTASKVSTYLLSKMGVMITTSLVTSLILVIPLMGLRINYGLLILILIATGVFFVSIGLIMTSYFRDLMQSFSVLYILIILLMLPTIAYFIPSWDPTWMRFHPTYYLIQSFKEIVSTSTNVGFVLLSSLGFLGAGAGLFAFANYRFKKTLTL